MADPQNDRQPSLSPAEWQVMKVLWEGGSMAARDIHAALEPESQWAMSTVKTLLARLVAKGALDYRAVGNSYLYTPAISRDEATNQEMAEFVSRVMDGDVPTAIARFVKSAPLKPDQIAELRRLLQDAEIETGKQRRTPR